jgi:hypothetical protein
LSHYIAASCYMSLDSECHWHTILHATLS